jgi:predicted lysophospholipase L1 biosynthesis ABC-type transport system permease subunit
MPVRLRKFLGAVALFVLVIAWALIAMAVAQFPAVRDNAVLSVLYYVIAGLGWILPAMPLVSWMSAPRSTGDNRKP